MVGPLFAPALGLGNGGQSLEYYAPSYQDPNPV